MTKGIFASDLDGTLLNEKSKISAKTAEAVKMAQNAGFCFMAATGRSWVTAHMIFEEAGISPDYVLLNGAEFRSASGEVIYQEPMKQDVANQIIDALLKAAIDFEINTDQGDFSTNRKVCQTAAEFSDLLLIRNQELKILKIFAFSDEETDMEKVRSILQGFKGISVTTSAKWNVEITAESANKGNMLKKAAEYYKVPKSQVVVFGDGENDETMFREFQHSRGVGNAVPLIQSLAEKVIENHQNDGVAKEMIRICKIGGQDYE